jgi:hypothetical protein
MTPSTKTAGMLPERVAPARDPAGENRVRATATKTTGGTMAEAGDPRHHQHAQPAHVTPDDRDGARDAARRWVRRKRIFYTVVGIYLALSLMWFGIDMLDGPDSLWFYWPMLGTGLGVAVTGLVLFGLGGLFGAEWERRQVERYLDRQGDQRSGPDARS